MRIIAGEFRGRKLLPPEGDVTRPVTDRVKQSLFDILTPHIEGAAVYDCFAGTGSMGLECLSRGAAHATFFENNRSAAGRLRRNIETLGVGDRSAVVTQDIFRWPPGEDGPRPTVDLVFLDPPYRFLKERSEPLQRLATSLAHRLKDGGRIIFRHDARDQLDLGLPVLDRREYGGMVLEFLGRPNQTAAGV